MDLVDQILLLFLVLWAYFVFIKLDSLLGTDPLVLKIGFGLVLQVLESVLPFGDFLKQVGSLQWEILDTAGLFL